MSKLPPTPPPRYSRWLANHHLYQPRNVDSRAVKPPPTQITLRPAAHSFPSLGASLGSPTRCPISLGVPNPAHTLVEPRRSTRVRCAKTKAVNMSKLPQIPTPPQRALGRAGGSPTTTPIPLCRLPRGKTAARKLPCVPQRMSFWDQTVVSGNVNRGSQGSPHFQLGGKSVTPPQSARTLHHPLSLSPAHHRPRCPVAKTAQRSTARHTARSPRP